MYNLRLKFWNCLILLWVLLKEWRWNLSCFCITKSNSGNNLPFWFNKSHFKIYSNVENRKIVNNIMHWVKILPRHRSQTNHLEKYKVYTDLILVADIKKIFSPAYFEEVHWDDNNSFAVSKIAIFFGAKRTIFYCLHIREKVILSNILRI